jgi:hypothetical protein
MKPGRAAYSTNKKEGKVKNRFSLVKEFLESDKWKL